VDGPSWDRRGTSGCEGLPRQTRDSGTLPQGHMADSMVDKLSSFPDGQGARYMSDLDLTRMACSKKESH